MTQLSITEAKLKYLLENLSLVEKKQYTPRQSNIWLSVHTPAQNYLPRKDCKLGGGVGEQLVQPVEVSRGVLCATREEGVFVG